MTLKGILFGAWAFLTLLGATSASLPHPTSPGALRVGDVLPKMKSLDVGGRQSAPESQPQTYRLIHFWAAYDAPSRAANQVWDHYFLANPHLSIRYQGVSVDPEQAIWRQTISWDQVDPQRQYCFPAEGAPDEYLQEAGLADGLHSYLVNAQGVVVAVDPTPAELTNFL